MASPSEIELKLDVPIDSLRRLSGSSLLKSAAKANPKRANVVSVYFDTDNHKLRRKGISLRVRRVGRRLVQTVKQEGDAKAALLDRREWEQDIHSKVPDLSAVRGTALEPLLTKKVRRTLKPVFETRVRRKVIEIQNNGSDIELCIDNGTVEAGKKSAPLCEVELELKQGEPGDLFKLAKALADNVPLRLGVRSKADRGYELLADKTPKAVKAAPVALTPTSDVQFAVQAIARTCLHQLVANQPAMLAGDPEGLHQMRVALRRLRAAISLFPGVLDDQQTSLLKHEFKWISGELGPARELDIFLKRVVQPVSDRRPSAGEIEAIARELRRKRKAAAERARTAVEGARFRNIVLDTAAWIETGDWTRNPDEFIRALRGLPIASAAADQLRRRQKAILKKGKQLDQLDPPRRHKLRIQAKKLRYASEFFSGAFPRKKSARRLEHFVGRLTKLQDALGDLNDIAVHADLSARLVDGESVGRKRHRDGKAKKAFAAGRLSGHEEARIAPVLKEAKRAYAGFAKAKPFWM